MKITHPTRLILALALCLLPVALLLLTRLLGGIGADVIRHTFAGLPVIVIGGLLAGIAAERLLHRSSGTISTLLGLALVGGLGVLTIGYIYLFRIQGPMSTITTVPRAAEQLALFLAFLLAEGAGILLAPIVLPSKQKSA